MGKQRKVERPTKRAEYTIMYTSNQAEKGWRDLAGSIRNPLTDCWDFLTRTPEKVTPTNYRLRGELGTITRNGCQYERWQHKPTRGGDARIWFYIDGQTVYLEQVHTSHPNETK